MRREDVEGKRERGRGGEKGEENRTEENREEERGKEKEKRGRGKRGEGEGGKTGLRSDGDGRGISAQGREKSRKWMDG